MKCSWAHFTKILSTQSNWYHRNWQIYWDWCYTRIHVDESTKAKSVVSKHTHGVQTLIGKQCLRSDKCHHIFQAFSRATSTQSTFVSPHRWLKTARVSRCCLKISLRNSKRQMSIIAMDQKKRLCSGSAAMHSILWTSRWQVSTLTFTKLMQPLTSQTAQSIRLTSTTLTFLRWI